MISGADANLATHSGSNNVTPFPGDRFPADGDATLQVFWAVSMGRVDKRARTEISDPCAKSSVCHTYPLMLLLRAEQSCSQRHPWKTSSY
jgi:hypothetical protein